MEFSNEGLASATAVFVDGDGLHVRVSPTKVGELGKGWYGWSCCWLQIERYLMSTGGPIPYLETRTSEESDFIMREIKFPTTSIGNELEVTGVYENCTNCEIVQMSYKYRHSVRYSN